MSGLADDSLQRRTQGSPLPWVIAAGLAAIYLTGWLLGLGTHPPPEAPVPYSYALILGLLRGVCWPLLVALIIFAAGASAGSALLRLMRLEPRRPFERLLFATALGLGLSAYATLGVGMLGLLRRNLFWALTALMLTVGYLPLVETIKQAAAAARRWMRSWGRFEQALAIGAGALVLIWLVCAATPVMDYDTLEYHLGAPGEYYEAGRVQFLPHNVYANLPAHVGMLYLEGIILSGGKAGGMGAALMMQMLFGLLAAGAVGALAARFVRRDAGLLAAVFFLCCPLVVVTIVRGHITLARCFYKAVAVLGVLGWLYGDRKDRSAELSYLILGGLCCGLAVAVKYSALLLCAPLGASVLLVSSVRGKSWARRLAPPAILAGCALLAVLPWLARNLAATGNPFFPLLYGVFGAEGWSAAQAAKFASAHAPPPRIAGLLLEVWRFLTSYWGAMARGFTSPLAVLFIPLLLVPIAERLRGTRSRSAGLRLAPAALLAAWWVVFTLLWGLLTHRIARFLAPSLLLLCILSAAGFCVGADRKRAGHVCRTAVMLGLLYAVCLQGSIAYFWGGPGAVFFGEGLLDTARRIGLTIPFKKMTSYAEAVEWVNDPQNVASGQAVMLVGEARTYPFDRPVLYSVVFNDHPIEPALELASRDLPSAVEKLRSTGATHVLVNWFELRRLATSYSHSYGGEERSGYLPALDWQSCEPLRTLLDAAGARVAQFGLMPWPAAGAPAQIPVIEVYRLSP